MTFNEYIETNQTLYEMGQEERLQDSLPEERATYYIVKDYQRMYDEVERCKAMMRKASKRIGVVIEDYNRMKEYYNRVANAPELDKLKKKYDKMVAKRDKWKSKYEALALQVAQGNKGIISKWLMKIGL